MLKLIDHNTAARNFFLIFALCPRSVSFRLLHGGNSVSPAMFGESRDCEFCHHNFTITF